MSSLNKVTLIGNLGRDPDIRTTQSGSRLANLTVATSERWRDRDSGEQREKTEWHRVVVFNEGLVAIIENYLKKGSKIYLEGQLETRKWIDDTARERYTTEVVLKKYRSELVMLDSRPADSLGVPTSTTSSAPMPSSPVARSGLQFRKEGVDDPFDDDVPF